MSWRGSRGRNTIKSKNSAAAEIGDTLMKVYLVTHEAEIYGSEVDLKIIGVFESRSAAESAVASLSSKPGFSEYTDGFDVSEYEMNRIEWLEGFVRIEGNGD